jgi:tRNA-specific 2-thiouridylase
MKPEENQSIRILVAMSGGVDSSVAAALLVEQGYQVTGVTMKIWGGEPSQSPTAHHGCYGPEEAHDIEDAGAVARTLGIPFHVLDLTREYKAEVLDYFCSQYLSGRTPSPCVRCNQKIKFSALIKRAADSGLSFDRIASGHYARISRDSVGRFLLKKAVDRSKDQTYFLTYLSQAQLSALTFPLGELTKKEVREIAVRFGLPVARKPDSQNFISGDYADMISVESRPGPILDCEGKELGRHLGIHLYTVGQRKGLALSTAEVLYVTAIDPARNAIIVGPRSEVFRREFQVGDLNWIAVEQLAGPRRLKTRIRSSHPEADALVTPAGDSLVEVAFDEPQMAITPGQVAVFYDSHVVVGGGVISRVADCSPR